MNQGAWVGPAGPAGLAFPAEVFRARRERFLELLGDGAAVLPAAVQLVQGRDTDVRFRQERDFYYLTGFGEPDAVAVFAPRAEQPYTLFLRPRDPEREAWTGPRAGTEGAVERYGADAAHPLAELQERLPDLLRPADRIVYALGVHPPLDRLVIDLLLHFRARRPRLERAPDAIQEPDSLLGPMRLVKEPGEVERIRAAARLSAVGHLAALRAVRPGVGEWELEALLDATFRAAGADGPAFPSIVASGANAATLHHTANDRRMAAGELVLIDAGAELGRYCGDISRTAPVSGRFSAPQRTLYEVVLAAERAGLAAVRPGSSVGEVHDAAVRVLVAGMLELRLLEGEVDELIETEAYKRFYMHQTGHWLGLDVHDVGQYCTAAGPVAFTPGMVLTVEPGIYVAADAEGVPEALRGLGVRIEDNVVVTEEGHEVLTRGVPVDPDEIEALVGR